ncbi:LAQU0S13e02828g1_1 [Lachancea quebecensis]|uniref:LAQU0S13e02828g1_1 n=1 Tax=Lachancea quebecensis TaxID=1654605 RepID=A0A0P1KVZ7_9SACH|nr:LAQU0S13e02828g1_1 [Lachancea quebecensis]
MLIKEHWTSAAKAMDVEGHNVLADYFAVFNNELKVFMDPLSKSSELSGSFVHTKSRVKWVDAEDANGDKSQRLLIDEDESSSEEEDGEIENREMGVFWSAEEKELFFHHLSRSSIHRLEEWHNYLPEKSKFEIIAYYRVLQNNLTKLKLLDSKRHGRILAKADLPIAYEMDEFFVDMEEEMSFKAEQKLRILQEPPTVVSDTDDTDESTIINLKNWEKRWGPVYSRHGIEEYQPACRQALPLSKQSLTHIEECARGYLRRLLWFTVLSQLEKQHVPLSFLKDDVNSSAAEQEMEDDSDVVVNSKGKANFPYVITREEVLKGLTVMRQEGFAAPTLAEAVLSTLQKFNIQHKEGRLFRSTEVASGVIPRILEHAETARDLELYGCVASDEHIVCDTVGEDLFPHIHKKLFNLNGRRADSKPFVDCDRFDTINNPLEQELCDEEARNLDAHDMYRSRMYQHAMLGFLQGENAPLKRVAVQEPDLEPPQKSRIPRWLHREFQFE